MITFEIDIAPKSAQFGGKRLCASGGKIRFFRDASTQAYLDELALKLRPWRPKKPLEGPLSLAVIFILPRPKCLKINRERLLPHWKRPDRDNLYKTFCDVMTREGFWNDDAQIYTGPIEKLYAEACGKPRICVSVKQSQEGR